MVEGQYELTVVFTRDVCDDVPTVDAKPQFEGLDQDTKLVRQLADELQEACDAGLAGYFVVVGPPRYHDVDEGPPDLTRTDCYEGTVIPNADYETALKVVRTVRNLCLGPLFFDAEGSITLSYAHACLCRLAAACEGRVTPDEHHDVGGEAGGA